jgi:hypothetical protein
MRWLLILTLLVVLLAAVYVTYQGRYRRRSRFLPMLPPFPMPPPELSGPEGAELLPPTTGTYAGTAMAGDWQDQITIGDIGTETSATMHLSRAGVLLDRVGATPLWIPTETIRGARLGKALAGKVMTTDGLLVITWQLGGRLLDTGFNGHDKDVYPDWLLALGRLKAGEGAV